MACLVKRHPDIYVATQSVFCSQTKKGSPLGVSTLTAQNVHPQAAQAYKI
jgi:hypothetical protein